MSDAVSTPEQLDLDFQPTEGDRQMDGELFRRFGSRIVQLIGDHGVSEAVCAELRSWGQFHDFPVVASWSRRLLRDRDIRGPNTAAVLLECFGIAFRGDLVGHIGRDLIVRPLSSMNVNFRGAAINVLVRWLEYDDDGMWLDMAEDHLKREEDPELHARLQNYVLQFVADFQEEEEEDLDPLLEEFLEVRRNCECEMRGTFPIMKLGPVLAGLTGLDPRLLSGVLELVQMPLGAPLDDMYPHNHLGLLMSEVGGGRLLRVWDTNGSFAFSVEPTATEDRWLLFIHLR
jgi:hypothetical protein